MVINIKIQNRIATYIRSEEMPVCGSNLDTVKFAFDGEWDAYPNKFARFIYGTDHHDEPIDGDTCKVPMFINVKKVLIGVIVGEPGADEDCLATTMAEVEFKPSARCTNTAPSAGTIFNYTSEAQEYAAEARVAATDAEEWAVVSKNAANRATESAEYVEGVVNDARDEVGAVLSPQVDQNTVEIADNREEITILDKRLTNLEQGVTPDPFVTDTTGIVPVNALPYAEVVKVGGMTYRDEETNTLKTAKPTSIESRGINIWNGNWRRGGYLAGSGSPYDSDIATSSVDFIPVKPSTTYYVHRKDGYKMRVFYYDGVKAYLSYKDISATTTTFKPPTGACFIQFQTVEWTMSEEDMGDVCINVSNSAINGKYYPYHVIDTLEIPEAVQALDGYGVDVDCCNYIDWEKKQFHEKVGVVDLGTLTWTLEVQATGFTYYCKLMDMAVPSDNSQRLRGFVCAKYNASTSSDVRKMVDKSCARHQSNAFFVRDDDYYTDAASFKSAMAGVMLAYELADPIITDISDLLPDDNFIEVEGGGTIVAVNAENLEAPTEITYMTKEATV